MSWPVIAAVALAATAAGVWCARWLGTQGYRYDDERDLPTRRSGWVAVLVPVLVVLVVLAWPKEPVAVVYAAATVVLVVLAAIDLDVLRLPDKLTIPLAVGVVVSLLVVALIADDIASWVRAVLAGVALGVFYLVLVLLRSGTGMGLGDAKLAPSLGMLLGFQSWSHVILGTVVSFVLAAVAALYLVLFTGARRDSHIAFGPYLLAGTVLMLIAPVIGSLLGM